MALTEFQKLLLDLKLHMVAADNSLERFGSTEQTLLNMDFSIFQPFIYPTARAMAPQRFGNYDFISREIIKHIADYRGAARFSLVVSDLAFLELLDHADRRRAFAADVSNSAELSRRLGDLAQAAATDKSKLGLKSTTQIVNQLERAAAHLAEAPHRQRLQQLVLMLRTKVIRGLGDYFDASDLALARNGGQYFRQTLAKIDSFRSTAHSSDVDGGELNRLIDAWVVTISRSLHDAREGHRVQFLGPPRLRQIYGAKTDELSCTALSPYLELKAFQMADANKNIHDEARACLSMTAERLARILSRVGDAASVEDCLTADSLELGDVKRMLIRNYYPDEVQQQDDIMRGQLKALIDELAQEPRAIRDRYRQSADEHQKDAEEIVSAVPQILSDEFLNEYELTNNKRIKQLVKKYT